MTEIHEDFAQAIVSVRWRLADRDSAFVLH
jgi:hypothetical protein